MPRKSNHEKLFHLVHEANAIHVSKVEESKDYSRVRFDAAGSIWEIEHVYHENSKQNLFIAFEYGFTNRRLLPEKDSAWLMKKIIEASKRVKL